MQGAGIFLQNDRESIRQSSCDKDTERGFFNGSGAHKR